MYYLYLMKVRWNEAKNKLLKAERGVSFEQVLELIDKLDFIGPENNPVREGQKRIIVYFNNYPYIVPFVIEADGAWFFKTIYPSRKMKRRNDEKEI